jgi:hypothetical protein
MVSEHRQKADRTKYDSVWRTVSNAFYIHPFELIIGSLGLEYEHFFTTKHAAGIHSSFYLLGWGYSWNTVDHELNRFSGFKLAPYYRHYFHRTAYHGFFVEGRPEVGYFKMDPLLYRYWLTSFWFTGEYLTQGKKMEFWTGGISVNLGFDARFAKAPKGLFTFSIGLQYFPLRAPKNLLVPDEYGNVWYYERNENWWYFGGPGSIIQVKLGYGGIF